MLKLQYFDLFTSTPPCPGHSCNRGRLIQHFTWLIKGLSNEEKKKFEENAMYYSQFKGLLPISPHGKYTICELIKHQKLTAAETVSLSAIMLFCCHNILSQEEQKALLYHIAYVSNYYRFLNI